MATARCLALFLRKSLARPADL